MTGFGYRHWLRWLGSLLLLGAVLGVPQPVIICSCGAEVAHVHAALGFDPNHHHHEPAALTVVEGDSTEGIPFLESGDERLSATILLAYLTVLAGVVQLLPRPLPATPGTGRRNGLHPCPDSPPPRSGNVVAG